MQWRVGQCHIDIHIRVVIVNISVGTYSSYTPQYLSFVLCVVLGLLQNLSWRFFCYGQAFGCDYRFCRRLLRKWL